MRYKLGRQISKTIKAGISIHNAPPHTHTLTESRLFFLALYLTDTSSCWEKVIFLMHTPLVKTPSSALMYTHTTRAGE
jgi:hypothetical protein